MADSISRSIAKTITWRLIALVITFIIAYFFSDSVIVASGIAIFDFFIKAFIYFLHERAWTKIETK